MGSGLLFVGEEHQQRRVFIQKLEYIHNNPIRAGLCKEAEDYKYSSARFYNRNEKDWDFLVHYNG